MQLQKVLPQISREGVGGMNRVLSTLQQPDIAVKVPGCSPRSGAGLLLVLLHNTKATVTLHNLQCTLSVITLSASVKAKMRPLPLCTSLRSCIFMQ